MLIGHISRDILAQKLRREGVHLNTGAFTTQLQIELPNLVSEFAEMYAQYPVEDPPGIDDARLRIGPPSLLHRYTKARAAAWMNGERVFDSVPATRAYTLLESALNWVIASSDVAPLVVHAGVVERQGRALIMPAATGSGKSTLCAALIWRGWRLLSDEMAAFRLEDGGLLPNPRPVSLKNKAIEVIAAFEQRARLSRTYSGTPKGNIAYMQPPPDSVSGAHASVIPALVVTPSYRVGATATLKAMDKVEGFRLLVDNAVNYSSMLRTGFEVLTGIVERCRFYALIYSDLGAAVDLINRLEASSGADGTSG